MNNAVKWLTEIMEKNSNDNRTGLTLFIKIPLLMSCLTMLFVVLKLENVIQWSWWWVLCPLWLILLVCVFILGLYYIFIWRS